MNLKYEFYILLHKLKKWYIENEYQISMSIAMALMMGGIYAAIQGM